MKRRYDILKESPQYDHIEHIDKFNPYHGKDGRFASSNGYNTFTIRTKDPKKQYMADMAMERERQRSGAISAGSSEEQRQKRISDAENNLKSMLKDGAEVKLAGMDPDLAESTVKSISSVLERYPTLKEAFNGFSTDDTPAGTFANRDSVMGACDMSTRKIYLNNKFYSDKQNFEKVYKESAENKFHPEGTTADSVVVHEMGHAIDQYLSLKTMDAWKVNYGGDSVSSRKWNNDIKNAKKKGEPLTGKSIRETLSGYASKNHAEYFAEGVCEYLTSPSPRKNAISIGKHMETYIKKAAKAE